jgi:hypothetical protein
MKKKRLCSFQFSLSLSKRNPDPIYFKKNITLFFISLHRLPLSSSIGAGLRGGRTNEARLTCTVKTFQKVQMVDVQKMKMIFMNM